MSTIPPEAGPQETVPPDLSGLQTSSSTLVRVVDGLQDDDWAQPSLLPGWRRAHVVAHLALNAEGVAGAVEGLRQGQQVPMYPSSERRDRDIDELAEAEPAQLRERLMAGVSRLRDAFESLPKRSWTDVVLRAPGAEPWPVATMPTTRRREVELHLADLGVAYGPRDWPQDFCVELLDVLSRDQAAAGPFRVQATDLDRAWSVGKSDQQVEGETPTVSGAAADLGWWLSGRAPEELSSSTGQLPTLGAWRRTPAR